MENNLENRERFVALHWGQKVLVDTDNSGNKQYYPIERSNMYRIEESYLELAPISQITDEDANSITIYGTYDKASFNDLGYNTPSGPQHYAIDSVDFLRSKGYAMRWMGVSVETLVEWGWVKLTHIQ